MNAFSLNGLKPNDAAFNNTVWKRVIFKNKPLDTCGMIGGDGVITLVEPGWYHLHAQTYWCVPSIETSCYVALCDAVSGEILFVGNDENPAGQHPSIAVSGMVFSDGGRRIEIKACWCSTESADQTAVHSMQTAGNYVFAFGYKVG